MLRAILGRAAKLPGARIRRDPAGAIVGGAASGAAGVSIHHPMAGVERKLAAR